MNLEHVEGVEKRDFALLTSTTRVFHDYINRYRVRGIFFGVDTTCARHEDDLLIYGYCVEPARRNYVNDDAHSLRLR